MRLLPKPSSSALSRMDARRPEPRFSALLSTRCGLAKEAGLAGDVELIENERTGRRGTKVIEAESGLVATVRSRNERCSTNRQSVQLQRQLYIRSERHLMHTSSDGRGEGEERVGKFQEIEMRNTRKRRSSRVFGAGPTVTPTSSFPSSPAQPRFLHHPQ